MAKKNVVIFTDSDMPKPKKLASGLIGLRAPVDFNVQPGKTLAVQLFAKCNAVLLADEGVIMPGTFITAQVKNDSVGVANYAAGDVIMRALPVFPEDYEIK